ncbi:hypothetical protein K458DRAFT_420070 [Lentithecium fluviatile CBS 122367]|uniref:F-box domain-containing protein n=1 Tax=Lentithecium fluviatile CBS 122367 TaxID=1168545 RepID=A0A6G1IV50_9PLEO|nr:hypothetical protein K458DRAFT_420070 [Lentithecium fluviatile CBS 122367]
MMAFWKPKNSPSSKAPSSSKTAKASTIGTTQSASNPPESPPQQIAPLLTLPLELIQQIASYLDHSSAASLCLSSRYTCYAIGRNDLTKHLAPSCSLPRFQRRKNIEILERAFPSHWYCAWCDTFHRHDVDGGPTKFANETKRDCAEFNSYLHDGWEYVVCYHHVRLAVNRELWGKEYGISMEAFAYDERVVRMLGKVALDTRLKCRARVVESRLILHASYRFTVPTHRSLRSRGFTTSLVSILPQVVVGHRDSHSPHTGLRNSLEHALANGRMSGQQLCSVCATDFSILCHQDSTVPTKPVTTPAQPESQFTVEIRVWRDLGNGRNPFDASWRSHGELGKGREGFASDALRLASFRPGDIRNAFESGDARFASGKPPAGMERSDGKTLEDSLSESWTQEIIRSRGRKYSVAEREPTVLNALVDINVDERT